MVYFGIGNPGQTLPDKCTFANNFVCPDFMIDLASHTLSIKITNGFGQKVFSPSLEAVGADGSMISCNEISGAGDWASDDIKEWRCTDNTWKFSAKSKAKVKLTLNYQKISGGYNQAALGEVYVMPQ